ncbi:hypothetical protein QC762_0108710 [Podospora pseudocomata]|uniref:Uncharacterized protein n=1 Tax=Podospora pseudocomata TaxID=2093779 RepID=A0ABR0G3K6_9PEZI|nr:hypothetical protein QC762_0108710 [Podospora pseudocomata]
MAIEAAAIGRREPVHIRGLDANTAQLQAAAVRTMLTDHNGFAFNSLGSGWSGLGIVVLDDTHRVTPRESEALRIVLVKSLGIWSQMRKELLRFEKIELTRRKSVDLLGVTVQSSPIGPALRAPAGTTRRAVCTGQV